MFQWLFTELILLYPSNFHNEEVLLLTRQPLCFLIWGMPCNTGCFTQEKMTIRHKKKKQTKIATAKGDPLSGDVHPHKPVIQNLRYYCLHLAASTAQTEIPELKWTGKVKFCSLGNLLLFWPKLHCQHSDSHCLNTLHFSAHFLQPG